MLRIATVIAVAIALLAWQPGSAELRAQQAHPLSNHAEKMKEEVEGLGIGAESQVHVELRGKVKVAGYIKSLQADGFELFDTSTGTAKNVKYEHLKKVTADGGAWVQGRASGQRPRLGKAAIGVLIVLVVVVLALAASDKS